MTIAVAVLLACLALPSTAAAADHSGLGCDTAPPASVVDGPAWHAELVQLVNEHRASRGLQAVSTDAVLSRSATWKARDVIARGYGGHDDPGLDGRPTRTAQVRAQTCGFTSGATSENLQLARVQVASPRQVIDGWLASPSHRANIERPDWRFVGTGIAQGTVPMPDGVVESAFAQQFSTTAAPVAPRCSTATVMSPIAGRTTLDPRLCRSGGAPVLVGTAPTLGRLVGGVFVAPRAVGVARFTVRWPDTGVVQPVEVYVRPAASSAVVRRLACSTAGRCVVTYTLRRPVVAARATIQVQRRVGARWVSQRGVVLDRRSAATARVVVARGAQIRMRIVIARHPLQGGSASPWLVRRT